MFTTCGKCDLYSRSLLRCKEGKANPKTLKGTAQCIKLFGPSYICGYSRWKYKAIVKLAKQREVKA